MRELPELHTPRLWLRPWQERDREPFAALNADPAVMAHYPSTLTRDESDAMIERLRAHFEQHGFGLWAIESRGGSGCIGFVGLVVPTFETAFTPCVEIGWRLAHAQWGRGYATEGARAALRFGFTALDLPEIVAMTTPVNVRSQRVMTRIGMVRDAAADFEHPRVPEGHPLRPHVLYRLSRAAWRELGPESGAESGTESGSGSGTGSGRDAG